MPLGVLLMIVGIAVAMFAHAGLGCLIILVGLILVLLPQFRT